MCDSATSSRVLVVSGSNMSGKSTLLRTVGINAVLALAGRRCARGVCGSRRSRVGASIRIVDSLQDGTSRFYAEVQRLQPVVDLAARPAAAAVPARRDPDGTNSHDRAIGAEAVVRGLVERGAIGLVTTHDLALARIADAPRRRAPPTSTSRITSRTAA